MNLTIDGQCEINCLDGYRSTTQDSFLPALRGSTVTCMINSCKKALKSELGSSICETCWQNQDIEKISSFIGFTAYDKHSLTLANDKEYFIKSNGECQLNCIEKARLNYWYLKKYQSNLVPRCISLKCRDSYKSPLENDNLELMKQYNSIQRYRTSTSESDDYTLDKNDASNDSIILSGDGSVSKKISSM